jgi:ribosome-associated protein
MQKDFLETLPICCQILWEKKCTDLKIFDVRNVSGIADYMVLGTCTSEPHLKAIGNELYQTFKHKYLRPYRMDYQPLSGWVVFDTFDIIVHILTESMRQFYCLDELFGRSSIIELDCVLPIDIHQKSVACK